jgi:multimeric flavodoxin WrbA
LKALILNGGGLDKPYQEIVEKAEVWARQQDVESKAFDLTSMNIKPCRGCFGCWVRTPGLCFARDDMDRIMPHLAKSDWVFWITPIAFGGYGYHLKKAVDRSIPILLPFFIRIDGEVHHPLRYRYGERRLAVLGVLPGPDPESERIFNGLVERNAVNMHARPSSIVLYGNEANGRLGDRLAAFLSSMEK